MKAQLLVLLLAFAVSSNGDLISQLKEKVGNNAYGNQITELVDLHLQGGTETKEIVKLVGEVLEQLNSDQNTDDINHASRMAELDQTIGKLEENLEKLRVENQNNNKQVTELYQSIAGLATSLETLKTQSSRLNKREEVIRKTRSNEGFSYQTRQKSNNDFLNTMRKTRQSLIDKFLNNVQLIETDELDMKDIKDKIPKEILAEINSKDDKDYKKLIAQIDQFIESTEKNQLFDDQSEQESQRIFTTLVAEVSGLRSKFSSEFSTANNIQKTKINDLAIVQRMRDDSEVDLDQTGKLVVQTRQQRDIFDTGYQTRSISRKGEIQTIQTAYDLISNIADQN